MAEILNTGLEPSEKEEPKRSILEEARLRNEILKNDIETWRQRGKEKWRNLLGLDAPHAENGHTIEPLPSEVPPLQPDETIPSSYANLPVEANPPSDMPETVAPDATTE